MWPLHNSDCVALRARIVAQLLAARLRARLRDEAPCQAGVRRHRRDSSKQKRLVSAASARLEILSQSGQTDRQPQAADVQGGSSDESACASVGDTWSVAPSPLKVSHRVLQCARSFRAADDGLFCGCNSFFLRTGIQSPGISFSRGSELATSSQAGKASARSTDLKRPARSGKAAAVQLAATGGLTQKNM